MKNRTSSRVLAGFCLLLAAVFIACPPAGAFALLPQDMKQDLDKTFGNDKDKQDEAQKAEARQAEARQKALREAEEKRRKEQEEADAKDRLHKRIAAGVVVLAALGIAALFKDRSPSK